MKYGYVRVSTKDQNIDRQMRAIDELGIDKKAIYVDKISGKDFNRPNYKKMVKKLVCGDEIVIKSIDRLGRNYEEIIQQWKFLVKEKGVDITVLDFPLLNTKNGIDGLTGQFIADMVLQVLSYVSQIEREQIKQRQKEGIHEAIKKGIQFGRPRKHFPEKFEEIAHLYCGGHLSVRQAAQQLGVSKSTFYNWTKDIQENERK